MRMPYERWWSNWLSQDGLTVRVLCISNWNRTLLRDTNSPYMMDCCSTVTGFSYRKCYTLTYYSRYTLDISVWTSVANGLKCLCGGQDTREISKVSSKRASFYVNHATQYNEPLKPTALPLRPCQCVGADLCKRAGKQYLVVTDYYWRYLEIVHLESVTSDYVKGQNMFARWGIPEVLISDNGGQFASKSFKNFALQYIFCHIYTSPHFPRANGEAESAVLAWSRLNPSWVGSGVLPYFSSEKLKPKFNPIGSILN